MDLLLFYVGIIYSCIGFLQLLLKYGKTFSHRFVS